MVQTHAAPLPPPMNKRRANKRANWKTLFEVKLYTFANGIDFTDGR
jgi:hypothetical protein